MLKEIKNLFAFLTIIPIKMDQDCLLDSARYMFLFPLVGAIIGFLAGVFGWAISQILPSLVVGALVLGFLMLITGLHHTDGLLDFGDGVMYHGTAERKIEIMHDQLTGAGGLSLGIMTVLVTALCITQLKSDLLILIPALVTSEASAKLGMVIGAWAGKAVHQGMSSPFLQAMNGRSGDFRMVAALVIAFAVSVPILRFTGFFAVIAGLVVGLIMVAISNRHFGGITGDVLGATNELARMGSLIALLAMIR
jgi:adenosylcobinamide-GDP ribazoletransferase